MKWITLDSAETIPEQWDELAGNNIFLKRMFLRHLEKTNPCRQSYNLFMNREIPKAIYVDYRLKLDIFTYGKMNMKIPVRIMGIPCSVSKQGFAVDGQYKAIMVRHFLAHKGSKLILNCETGMPLKQGETLPACRLTINWRDTGHYLQSLRSHYRYRLLKALDRWSGVKVELLQPKQFDREMYRQYEHVYQRSRAKLEKQPFEFFRRMPLPASIIKASHQDRLLGFAMLIENREELIFLFTGFDYQLNSQYDTYLNLLFEILRYGLANGFEVIDFGQTAEETKMKLGCQLFPRRMYIHHSNPVLNILANSSVNLLSYRLPNYNFSVFKQEWS